MGLAWPALYECQQNEGLIVETDESTRVFRCGPSQMGPPDVDRRWTVPGIRCRAQLPRRVVGIIAARNSQSDVEFRSRSSKLSASGRVADAIDSPDQRPLVGIRFPEINNGAPQADRQNRILRQRLHIEHRDRADECDGDRLLNPDQDVQVFDPIDAGVDHTCRCFSGCPQSTCFSVSLEWRRHAGHCHLFRTVGDRGTRCILSPFHVRPLRCTGTRQTFTHPSSKARTAKEARVAERD